MERISLRLTMKLKEPHFVQLNMNSKILTFDFLLTRFLNRMVVMTSRKYHHGTNPIESEMVGLDVI